MNKDGVNVYEREKLYEEVWNAPVTHVAKDYGVSDVAIHKVCKSMNIPTPPLGYWTKLKAGKEVEKRKPLPPHSKGLSIKYGLDPQTDSSHNPLLFLSIEEQKSIYAIASALVIEPNQKFCKEILHHQKVVTEWNKHHSSILGLSCHYSEYRSMHSYVNHKRVEMPVLAGVVSNESLIRIYSMLNCINNAVTQLGYSIKEDFSFNIRGERVDLAFYERQESFEHVITPDEEKKIKKYEAEIKRNRYAKKPCIPSHHYRFNGNLVFTTKKSTYIRDTDKICIEDRLSDMLIQLVLQSEIVRKERLQREEKQRSEDEKRRNYELSIEIHNMEVDKLSALLRESNEFDIATKIRQYVKHVQQNGFNNEKSNWIDWANNKADWYDPTIGREDKVFGKRSHDAEPVPQKKSKSYWW